MCVDVCHCFAESDTTAIPRTQYMRPWYHPLRYRTMASQNDPGAPAKHPALTETAIAKAMRSAKATKTHKRLQDPGMEGLWLSVGKTGTLRWEARVRVAAEGGAPRWVGLGKQSEAGL